MSMKQETEPQETEPSAKKREVSANYHLDPGRLYGIIQKLHSRIDNCGPFIRLTSEGVVITERTFLPNDTPIIEDIGMLVEGSRIGHKEGELYLQIYKIDGYRPADDAISAILEERNFTIRD